jgi:hypothetical protein
MPIIDTPAGTLEVTNAILSASEFRATQKISVSNSAPTKNFSVGDKFHVSTTDADAVNITGNLVAQTLKIGNLLVSPTFDLAAVSNVGNTTSNTLQFANATTSFVASSNVEIGGNITLTSNAQVKVGSNVLAEYTGPHGREPTTPLLKKFPEIAFDESKFDSNPTTNTYTQAGYTVTASSDRDDRKAWEVFDGISDGVTLNAWQTGDIFSTSTGLPTSSTETYTDSLPGGTNHTGVTLKLQLPKAIQISRIFMSAFDNTGSDDRSPKEGVFLGSTNGTSWELIKSFTESDLNYVSYNGDESGKVEATITEITNTSYYSYIVLIVKKIQFPSLYGVLNIKEIKYYGYEEPAPPGDLSLDTTLKSTFNSVRSNNYVMYFDGEDPDTGNVPKYLPSGSVKSITPNNVVFDATNNCWTLDGSTESNVTTGSLGFEGDVPHTVSTWINASNLEANALTQQIFSIGSGYDKSFLKVDDTQIAANTWHNVTYAYQGEGGSKVTYVDGRKVEEAQVEDTFGEYPPFAMTDYEVGGYRVSASSEYNTTQYNAWKAFDSDTSPGSAWLSANAQNYNGGSGLYSGSANLGSDSGGVALPDGEWIKIELPHRIYLDYLWMVSVPVANGSAVHAKDFKVFGSNNDKNWDEVLSRVGHPIHHSDVESASRYITADTNDKAYKYYALVITRLNGFDYYTWVSELKLYGHKEGDLTRFPEPTRVLKYPHVTMTGPAQRGYVASASNHNNDVRQAYKAFNNDTSDSNQWRSSDYNNGTYNSTTGDYTGSANLGSDSGGTAFATADEGEWIKLELSHKIKLQSFSLKPRNSSGGGFTAGDWGQAEIIKTGKLWASIDGTSWINICTITGNSASSLSEVKTFTAGTNFTTPTIFYKYYALVIEETNAGGGSNPTTATGIGEFQLYGTQEDTETPLIVGGPFAGKVANFRVYDQYLGDERIQEIYDAQKDEFGHKKSSMTFYKGRVGVGTTEPEGALTVIDEPHALAKFPARAISADDSYVEGDGQIKLSAADGSGYQAFDGLTSTSWTATPTRNTRLSEEVDFGAWLKIQTPESMSLKKAEIESKPDLVQVGNDINGSAINDQLGRAVACSHDGTRIIAGGHVHSGDQGMVRVYDWNGTTWELIGNQTITGTADNDKFGTYVAISGDGNIIAVAAPFEHANGDADKGVVRVYYLVGSTWTILPDSGSLTETETGFVDAFVGSAVNGYLGGGGIHLSYDGRTLLITELNDDSAGTDRGQVRIYTYDNGAWSQKGDSINGTVNSEKFGSGSSMSEDGNHIVVGTSGDITSAKVKIYKWNGTNAWVQKGSDLTYTGNDQFGPVVSISNDGNTVAVGIRDADIADGALADNGGLVHVYHWSGSAWGTPHKLRYNEAVNEQFGSAVKLSGDGKILIVGAGIENSYAGELFMYKYTGSSWINLQNIQGGTTGYLGYGPGTGLADSITISKDGSTIVGGELGYNSGFVNSGRVRVFSMPSNIKSIWGSNDDVNWTKITTAPTREEATSNVAGLAFGFSEMAKFTNIDNPNYYKYHAIVADAFTRLKDVKLFGIRNQGSSTLHDGALTLTKNLDVPRIGPPLDADDTPRRDRLVVEYNTSTNPVEDGVVRDTSGRGFDGCLKGGAYYDATEKALKFDGTGDYTEVQLPRHQVKGDWIHSVSCWVKGNVINGEEAVWNIGDRTGNPSGVQASTSTLSFNSASPTLRWYFYSNDGSTNLYTINEGDWNHIVCVYYGGGHTGTNSLVYINGNKVLLNSFTASAPLLFDETRERVLMLGRLAWGTNSDLNGSISNFKLYDVALTPEEAKTLYDMGRTGSVANPQPLHIAAPLYSPGTIVQVESATMIDTWSSSLASSAAVAATTFLDVEGMSVNIHPKFSNSKFLISYHANIGGNNGHVALRLKRTRNGVETYLAQPTAGQNRMKGTAYLHSRQTTLHCFSLEHLDNPGNDTGDITYQLVAYSLRGDAYYIHLNKSHIDSNNEYYGRSSSTITVKEICQ